MSTHNLRRGCVQALAMKEAIVYHSPLSNLNIRIEWALHSRHGWNIFLKASLEWHETIRTDRRLSIAGPGDLGPIINEHKGGFDMSKNRVLVMMAAVFVIGAVFAVAQTTTYEIRQGTVLNHYDNNLVVRMADGEVREVEVPEGFMFNVDGEEVPLSALKPGTQLTASVATTTTPKTVQVTEVRNVEVVRRDGQTIIIRNQEGKLVKYSKVPENIKLMADGKEIIYADLYAGMKLNAYIVHEERVEVTEQDIAVAGTAPAAPAAPAAAPAPAPVAAPAVLPKTGSSLPLAGLAGIALLMIAVGIAAYRRF